MLYLNSDKTNIFYRNDCLGLGVENCRENSKPQLLLLILYFKVYFVCAKLTNKKCESNHASDEHEHVDVQGMHL